MTDVRDVAVFEGFDVPGRGVGYLIAAPLPPVVKGDLVRIHGAIRRVLAVEYQATNPPRYVVDGKQVIVVQPISGDSGA